MYSEIVFFDNVSITKESILDWHNLVLYVYLDFNLIVLYLDYLPCFLHFLICFDYYSTKSNILVATNVLLFAQHRQPALLCLAF